MPIKSNVRPGDVLLTKTIPGYVNITNGREIKIRSIHDPETKENLIPQIKVHLALKLNTRRARTQGTIITEEVVPYLRRLGIKIIPIPIQEVRSRYETGKIQRDYGAFSLSPLIFKNDRILHHSNHLPYAMRALLANNPESYLHQSLYEDGKFKKYIRMDHVIYCPTSISSSFEDREIIYRRRFFIAVGTCLRVMSTPHPEEDYGPREIPDHILEYYGKMNNDDFSFLLKDDIRDLNPSKIENPEIN